MFSNCLVSEDWKAIVSILGLYIKYRMEKNKMKILEEFQAKIHRSDIKYQISQFEVITLRLRVLHINN